MGTEYVVTNKKVILKSGILSRDALELVLNKCEGIRINQSLMGRMLGFGSIVVTTGGVTNKFDFITNPIKFRNEINAQILLLYLIFFFLISLHQSQTAIFPRL